jgi:hypothetical protein
VTSFEYQLYPMEPTIVGGMMLYAMEQARDVLRFYRGYSQNAPDDLTAFAGLLTTPDGHNVVAIIAAWFGPLIKPLTSWNRYGNSVFRWLT